MPFIFKKKSSRNIIQTQEEALRSSDDDLQQEATFSVTDTANTQPHTLQNISAGTPKETHDFIPLSMSGSGGRTHTVSKGSKFLVKEVGLAALQEMTSLFYEKAFRDRTLDKFIRNRNDPHGDRFAKWIYQKLSGSTVWDDDRRRRSGKPVVLANNVTHVVHDRSSAHVAAWYSAKRPIQEVGRHFELDECRVWMRLHFWALRECGMLQRYPAFSDYYVRFIGHFVRVYESTAPAFARESLRWSENSDKIDKYIKDNYVMTDVLGLTLWEAKAQLPASEANDPTWPYNLTPLNDQMIGNNQY